MRKIPKVPAALGFLVTLILVIASCKHSPAGAGSTFAERFYNNCIEKAGLKDVMVYKAVGSGEGINLFQKKEVEFAGSDWPVKKSVADQQIPIVAGGVAIVYNVRNLSQPLRFTPEVLSGIFGGIIKRWDDRRILKYNPSVGLEELPSKEIQVIYRSDGSGTTWIFCNFLKQLSPGWKDKNCGFKITWPRDKRFTGAEKGGPLAESVIATENSIGYVEVGGTRDKDNLSYGDVQNNEEEFVEPSLEGIQSAIPDDIPEDAEPEDIQQDLPLARGLPPKEAKKAYPIVGFTWLLLPNPSQQKSNEPLRRFLDAALGQSQIEARRLHYVPLPKSLVCRYRKQLELPINKKECPD